MNITIDRAVIEQAVAALERPTYDDFLEWASALKDVRDALHTALEQPQPVQVSPLDFTHAVIDKEDAVGRPIFWAEWPNREKA